MVVTVDDGLQNIFKYTFLVFFCCICDGAKCINKLAYRTLQDLGGGTFFASHFQEVSEQKLAI